MRNSRYVYNYRSPALDAQPLVQQIKWIAAVPAEVTSHAKPGW
jgi:hypothetical protein